MSQKYPKLTKAQATIKHSKMMEALSIAQEISSKGVVNEEPWVCHGVEFVDTLPQHTQDQLQHIKTLWIQLYAFIVFQIACSGGTVFGLPHMSGDLMDPAVIFVWCLLNYAPLSDSFGRTG